MSLHRVDVRPLLMVMNPRNISRCMKAILSLNVDKVLLKNMFEAELVDVISNIVEEHEEYTHFMLLADDTVPSQKALEAVLSLAGWGHPVVTGFCNLDATEEGVRW